MKKVGKVKRLVNKLKYALTKRDSKQSDSSDEEEISCDLLGFDLNTLFEDKSSPIKKRKRISKEMVKEDDIQPDTDFGASGSERRKRSTGTIYQKHGKVKEYLSKDNKVHPEAIVGHNMPSFDQQMRVLDHKTSPLDYEFALNRHTQVDSIQVAQKDSITFPLSDRESESADYDTCEFYVQNPDLPSSDENAPSCNSRVHNRQFSTETKGRRESDLFDNLDALPNGEDNIKTGIHCHSPI